MNETLTTLKDLALFVERKRDVHSQQGRYGKAEAVQEVLLAILDIIATIENKPRHS